MIDKHRRRDLAWRIESTPNWVLLVLAAAAFLVSSFAGSFV